MKNNYDLYLKFYALILGCVLKTFVKQSIYSFELDTAQYVLTTGYSCDVGLRFTDDNLKLISDIERQFYWNLLKAQ